jgi:hypothetical protein
MRSRSRLILLALSAACLVVSLAPAPAVAMPSSPLVVTALETEHARNPLGIDVARPRLSWILSSSERGQRQTAYQILVASSLAKLAAGEGDIWDSGKVQSRQSVHVPYDGKPLKSRTRYHWTVRVWDRGGEVSGWADPAWWETGLLSPSDWHAEWIHRDTEQATPVNNTEQNYPAKLEPGHTLGQTFTVDGEFISAAGRFPTWGRNDSDATLTLRRGGPTGEIIATRQLTDHPDNGWGTVEFDQPQPAGTYYLELSAPNGDIGWWSHSSETLANGSAYADGSQVAGDRTLRVDVARSPEPLLRREFTVDKSVARARLYATALGVYELRLNGRRVGDYHLAPGWTDYHTRIQYQTYDVTDLLQPGENALGALLGQGWYAGHIAIFGPNQYGTIPHLLAQLEISYADGTSQIIATNGSWQASAGPITSSDLLMGETYDARLEPRGWDTAAFDTEWDSVVVGVAGHKGKLGELVAENGPAVEVTQEIQAVAMTEPVPGTYVFDMGQNMVGNVRLRVQGEAGMTVRLRHAEVLNPDGTLYTANLRSAKATDYYILSGNGVETYTPRFTFHGFRYVEVTGYPGTPDLSTVTGRVLGTAAPITAQLHTSNAMVNKLAQNILWGQRGNFLSIPTDTPARDERMGWTGDINVFVGAAAYNMQVDPFLTKWLQDLRDAQMPDGAFPDVAPRVGFIGGGAAGWGDAGVTVPWTLWQRYGDTRIIEQHYDAMVRWIDYLVAHSDGYIRPAEGYGDWLNVDDETAKDLIATAYFARSTKLVADMAEAIGKTDDATRYRALAAEVTRAFRDAYVLPDGRVKGDTQTGYVLALTFDLLPANLRHEATAHLVRLIEQRDWHLSTGFLGTPGLLPALSENGELDVAYRLLLQDTYPSWGYQIARGATTMWEHWDSIKPDGSFENPAMNSFNHYAYGAVGEWLYRNIGGINPDPEAVGFQQMVIRPRPGGGIDHATASYDSIYGEISTSWRRQGHRFTLDVTIPANTTATVHVPAVNPQAVTENGVDAGQADGVRFLRMEDGAAVYKVGSGSYTFESDDVRGHLAAAVDAAEAFQDQVAELAESGALTGRVRDELVEWSAELVAATGLARTHYSARREQAATATGAAAQARVVRLQGFLRELVADGSLAQGDADPLFDRLDDVGTELSAAAVGLHGVAVSLVPSSSAVLPGSTVRFDALIENGGMSVLHDPEVVLDLPEGWSAAPAGSYPKSIGAGETATLPLDVSVPAGQPLAESLPLAGAVHYRRGPATVSAPVRAIVDVASPVEIVAVEATPRVLERPGDTITVAVAIRNRLNAPLAGVVTMSVPDGWAVDPRTTPYQLGPGEQETVTAQVSSPSDVAAPAADIGVTTTYGDLFGATATVRVTSALVTWTFDTDGDPEGWRPANHLSEFVVAGGSLRTTSTGGDPYMIYGRSLSLDVTEGASVELTMVSSTASDAQIFWGTEEQPFFSEGKSTKFSVQAGGPHTYVIPIPPQTSRVTMLRIDPLTVEGEVRIDTVRVVR